MSERKHHPYSPSQLQALEACPSFQGTDSQSEAAETGTRQHAVAETGQDDESLTDEQATAVADALAFVDGQIKLLEEARTKDVNSLLSREGCTVEEAEAAVKPVVDMSEVYLAIDDEVTTAGTADRILLSHDRKRAILVDYKYGKHAVEPAANNRQSDAYALGVFHAYPSVERVQVFFFQPAVAKMNTEIWTRLHVPELLLRIRVIVARAKAARLAGDFSTASSYTPVCLFCRHLAVCPAVAEKVISVAKKFAPLLVPSDLTPTRVAEPAEAACGFRLAALVEAWAKAYKALATDRALAGGPLPAGYKLTSRSTREVVDVVRLKQVALMFLTAEEVETTIDIAMTKIEKIISNKAARGAKTATIEAFQMASEAAGAIKEGQPYAFLRAETA